MTICLKLYYLGSLKRKVSQWGVFAWGKKKLLIDISSIQSWLHWGETSLVSKLLSLSSGRLHSEWVRRQRPRRQYILHCLHLIPHNNIVLVPASLLFLKILLLPLFICSRLFLSNIVCSIMKNLAQTVKNFI